MDDDGIPVSLAVDDRLDVQNQHMSVKPIIDFFQRSVAPTPSVFRTKPEFRSSITSKTAYPFRVCYFCCHGTVTGSAGRKAWMAELELSDEPADPIKVDDLQHWLRDREGLESEPVLRQNSVR